jgi:NADPH:quinone reductase-like Zn-dependent oxidoreductase
MSYQQIAIEKYGSASTLKVSELAPREPAADEVAIDVAYSGINFADIQMRLGFYPDAPKKPFVPGYEVSGKVTAVGKDVTDVKLGDAVIAGTYFGGYQSHVTIPARQVFKLPTSIDLAAGAAIPVNYFTAQLALFEMARVRKGDRVLIECATGGVGVLAIQMARHVGAEVTGLTTSPHKKQFIEDLGAIAYTREEFRADESLRGYDFILNASGGGEINWQRARLGLTGRMVWQAQLCPHRARRAPHAEDQRAQAVRRQHRHLRAQRAPRAQGSGLDRAAHQGDDRRRGDEPQAARRQGIPGDRGRRRPRVPRDQAGHGQSSIELELSYCRTGAIVVTAAPHQ